MSDHHAIIRAYSISSSLVIRRYCHSPLTLRRMTGPSLTVPSMSVFLNSGSNGSQEMSAISPELQAVA